MIILHPDLIAAGMALTTHEQDLDLEARLKDANHPLTYMAVSSEFFLELFGLPELKKAYKLGTGKDLQEQAMLTLDPDDRIAIEQFPWMSIEIPE